MEQTMRVKIPTDPTLPNPQDPKDSQQSHAGGGSDFMPYVPPWELLADALKRVSAGGRPIEMAKTDLCRAIADGTVNIRCKLKRHTIRLSTSKAVLEGKNFHIPTEIKPEDLDWETSCPLKPWYVRRGSFSPSGFWYLELIQVCRADVTKVLCVAREREPIQNAAVETPATATSPSTAQLRQPIASGPGPRRGVKPEKLERVKTAMRSDIQQGQLTPLELENMIEKNLAPRYGVSRDTARKARKAILSELNSRQTPTNDN